MTQQELETCTGGFGIEATCFFPADVDFRLRPARRREQEPALLAVEFPICLYKI